MAEEKKYYIKVQGELVEVSKDVYLTYYRMERKARCADERDQYNGTMLFSDLNAKELRVIEAFQDPNTDPVEEMVVASVMKEKLHHCLYILPQQERSMIYALYFEGLSERQLSDRMGIHFMTIHARKVRALQKLKKLMTK